MVNLRIAAYLCGLGEIGWSKMFLTKKFGPRQRIGIVLTEAEFEPDPIMKPGTLCKRCMACVDQCPSGAIPRYKSVKVKLGGYDVEWADVDMARCDFCFRGAEVKTEEDGQPDYTEPMHGHRTKPGWWSPFRYKPRNLYNSGQAVCGARGCTRACMIAMEKQGLLDNTFDKPFRRRKPWSVDWEKEDSSREEEATESMAD
jgi:ferredoxin